MVQANLPWSRSDLAQVLSDLLREDIAFTTLREFDTRNPDVPDVYVAQATTGLR